VGVAGVLGQIGDGDVVLVDGIRGRVTLAPGAEARASAQPKQSGSTSEPKTQDAATDWAWLVAAAALLFVVLDLAWLTRRPRKAAA
jgi:phosphoenolpyruvate-protein kinase (PTS system EI component)